MRGVLVVNVLARRLTRYLLISTIMVPEVTNADVDSISHWWHFVVFIELDFPNWNRCCRELSWRFFVLTNLGFDFANFDITWWSCLWFVPERLAIDYFVNDLVLVDCS